MTDTPAVSRNNFTLALTGTLFPGAAMAEQAIRKNVVQGTGVRRIIRDIRSSTEDPGNLLLVPAILFALAVLIALIFLTGREYYRWRKERKK
jgi:uncharacterized protein HemY